LTPHETANVIVKLWSLPNSLTVLTEMDGNTLLIAQ